MTDEQKINIGTQLGKFLKQLHNITDYGEINTQTPVEQIAEYTKMYQKDRNLLEAFFDESELKIIDDFFIHEVPKCMKGSGELAFCHGMDDDTLREAMMEAYGGGEILSLAAAKATSKMIDILNLPYIIQNRNATERDECVKRIRAEFFPKSKIEG